jgi:hypothetical protein
MRGLRSFGGLVVILIALGGYLYFVESKKPAGGDAEKKEKAFTVEADKIEEFTIKSESGERTTLRKSGSDWQIAQAPGVKPDSGEVSGITSNLSSLEIQRVIDENPSDLTEYNLTQPRVEVGFKAAGKDHKLLIGRKTPPGSDLYARVDDQKRVVLIPSFVDTTFNKTTFDLRDKAVLAVNRDEIGWLGVTTPASTMRFEKSSGEWKLTQPVRRARFQRGRSARQPLDEPPDEIHCRASGNRLRAVWPRQTGRDGDHRLGIVPGHARNRQIVWRRRGLRARPVQASRRDS